MTVDVIAPQHRWRARLRDVIVRHAIPVSAMDFPEGWERMEIWEEKTA
jgi:hypothetical protein